MIALLIALLLGCPAHSIEAELPVPAWPGASCVYINYSLRGIQ
jgi:hypothetical protein